ncbi:1e2fb40e-5653-4e82-9a65-cd899906e114 [Sclerotinia trifoliorum]|uniref:1e2fb40e-5653-4e82-9a65-cd899906e114 n=1 Tax=Sclerotinia trifoliorum TaxID=28548 RepID=A0A8H2W313_9HELO|nr:1e2fb40e-5653-4e82-9a65-cd899906e114 [Sclerotinia trifoliorum]
MRLRSGSHLRGSDSSEREGRSQLAGRASQSMEAHNFTDFGSNSADVGSSSRSGSPPRSRNQISRTSNGETALLLVPSSRYEGSQETHYSTRAPSSSTQRPYSARPSSPYQPSYSESSVPASYPITSSQQPYTTTSQPGSTYPSYTEPYTTTFQLESIDSHTSTSYLDPPPPAVPTPPPLPSHYTPYHPSQRDSQTLPHYHPTQFQRVSYPASHPHVNTPTNLPSLSIPIPQIQIQPHHHHHQQQPPPEEPGPWSPLSPHESRKRRASDTLSSAALGLSDTDLNWGYKDKMGEELDCLEKESRKRRRRGEMGWEGAVGNGGGRGVDHEEEHGDSDERSLGRGRGSGEGSGYGSSRYA